MAGCACTTRAAHFATDNPLPCYELCVEIPTLLVLVPMGCNYLAGSFLRLNGTLCIQWQRLTVGGPKPGCFNTGDVATVWICHPTAILQPSTMARRVGLAGALARADHIAGHFRKLHDRRSLKLAGASSDLADPGPSTLWHTPVRLPKPSHLVCWRMTCDMQS